MKEIRTGKLKQETVNKIIKNGFDDYNNDYHSEICEIVRAIFKDKNIVISKDQVSPFLNVVIHEANVHELFNQFAEKEIQKAIATYEYEKNYFSKSIEELQKTNPNSPFRVKRKV